MKINDWQIQARPLLFLLKKHNFVAITSFGLWIVQLCAGMGFWPSLFVSLVGVFTFLFLLQQSYQRLWWHWPLAGSIQKFPAFKPRPLYEVIGQTLNFHASDVKKIIFQFSHATVYLKVNQQKGASAVTCKTSGDCRFLAAKINHEIFISPIGGLAGSFQLEFPAQVQVVVSGRSGAIIAHQASHHLQLYLQKGLIELAETKGFCYCQLSSGKIVINNARGEVQVHKGVANLQINFSPQAQQGRIFFESGAGNNEIFLPSHAILNAFVDCAIGKFSSDFVGYWKNGTFVVKGTSLLGDTRVKLQVVKPTTLLSAGRAKIWAPQKPSTVVNV